MRFEKAAGNGSIFEVKDLLLLAGQDPWSDRSPDMGAAHQAVRRIPQLDRSERPSSQPEQALQSSSRSSSIRSATASDRRASAGHWCKRLLQCDARASSWVSSSISSGATEGASARAATLRAPRADTCARASGLGSPRLRAGLTALGPLITLADWAETGAPAAIVLPRLHCPARGHRVQGVPAVDLFKTDCADPGPTRPRTRIQRLPRGTAPVWQARRAAATRSSDARSAAHIAVVGTPLAAVGSVSPPAGVNVF